MTNNAAKGTAMELECARLFKRYMSARGTLVAEWRTIRTGIRTKHGYISHNNDFLGYDLAFLYRTYSKGLETIMDRLYLIQVKSAYEEKEYKKLVGTAPFGSICYFAVYGSKPNKTAQFTEGIFNFIRVYP